MSSSVSAWGRTVTAALAVCFLASCSRQEAASPGAVKAAAATIAPVAKAAPADLSREVALTAEFRPYQEVDVHAKVAGYLKKIYVDVGDRVKQGQLLAELEIPEMASELTRASASIRLSQANVDKAREELARSQSAHEASHLSYTRLSAVLKNRPNLVAQQEIDEAQARDRMNEAQVSSARAALAAAEQQVEVSQAEQQKTKTLDAYSRITAPFTGVVTKRYADTGAMIQAGTASQTQAMPLVRIAQNDLLRLVVAAPESMVPRIRIGTAVEVKAPTLGRSFSGRVARFSGNVSMATRTMETEVDVPNPGLVLVPGMYAEVALTTDHRANTLAVPVEAVANPETAPSVMIVAADNRLEERPVKLGLETARRVEILSGLADGDLVLVGSRSQFRPGQTVQPKILTAQAKEAK